MGLSCCRDPTLGTTGGGLIERGRLINWARRDCLTRDERLWTMWTSLVAIISARSPCFRQPWVASNEMEPNCNHIYEGNPSVVR
jgi:hypothetical protein